MLKITQNTLIELLQRAPGGTNQPSIVTQLLGTVHRITRAIDQGSQTDVSHAYLIGKLTNLE